MWYASFGNQKEEDAAMATVKGQPVSQGEKSGADDVLMAREWGLTKGVINHDKCY